MQLGHYEFDKTIDEYQTQIAEIVNNKKTLIFFDTNILAYLYKLHINARNEFYAWADSVIKDERLLIPSWAASEYSNRVTTNKLDDYTNKNNNASPEKARKMYNTLHEIASLFVDTDILNRSGFKGSRDEFLDQFKETIKSLDTFTRVFNTQFKVGDVHKEIREHFSKVILNSNLTDLCVKANFEGDIRFEHRLPPGFKDGKKEENRFGDLIIWYEILIKSEELKGDFEHVVFLSNDEKSDWVYAPKTRANTNTETRKFVANNNPAIKIADPRLVTEFFNRLGHSNFTVCSLALLIESLSKTEPQNFTNLAGAIQINIQETSITEKGVTEPAEGSTEPAEGDAELAEVSTEPAEVSIEPVEVSIEPVEVSIEPVEVSTEPVEEDASFFEYSQEALQDSLYQTDAPSKINEIIRDLKSYNWYAQNPAISRINTLIVEKNLDPSSCFVMGRNIYQAACGNSQKASGYMASLHGKLSFFSNEIANHILAGMAYEIYFNSESQYRESAKFDYGSEVLSLLIYDDFRHAKDFIKHHLQNYVDQLLFVPGDQWEPPKEITINIRKDEEDKTSFVLDSVVFMGKELITEDSSAWYYPVVNLPKIRAEISTQLAIPKWALTLKPNETVGDRRLELPEGKILNPRLALNRETT